MCMHATGTHHSTSARCQHAGQDRRDRHDGRRVDRGFTLVEILIAIVLVGILSAVVVVGISNLTSKGSASACAASADAARAASTIHFANTGQQPATITAMVDKAELVLPDSVTIDASGLVATGDGWTMTLRPGAVVTYSCSTGATNTLTVTNGLVSRLDAANPASLFQDSAGTTATVTAGQRVCRWADTSGTSTHALQSSTALCPKYGTDGTGGYLDFDANGLFTVTPNLSPDFSVFVVAQSDTPTWNTYGWLMAGRGANGLIIHPWVGTRNVGGYVIAGGTTYRNVGQVTPADITRPHLYQLSAAGNAPRGFYGLDGTNAAYTEPASGRAAAAVPIKLGADDINGRYGDGKYREVLIFNRALSAQEIDQVEAYLTTKWKLS